MLGDLSEGIRPFSAYGYNEEVSTRLSGTLDLQSLVPKSLALSQSEKNENSSFVALNSTEEAIFQCISNYERNSFSSSYSLLFLHLLHKDSLEGDNSTIQTIEKMQRSEDLLFIARSIGELKRISSSHLLLKGEEIITPQFQERLEKFFFKK